MFEDTMKSGHRNGGNTNWFTALFEKLIPVDEAGRDTAAEIAGLRILGVDDNATNRLVLRQQLASWHCRFEEAPGGEEALAKLREAALEGDPFRIAILDMQMPDMDGETLGRRIRNEQALDWTRLILMTSMGMRGDAARARRIGFAAYLPKPMRQSRLFDALIAVEKSPGREPRVFDKESALSRVGGDEAVLNEILDIFVSDADRQIELLVQASQNGDCASVRGQAHSLKSASGSIGACVMQELAQQIETAGSLEELDQAAILIPRVREEFGRFTLRLMSSVTNNAS